jgi:hypothetical protein
MHLTMPGRRRPVTKINHLDRTSGCQRRILHHLLDHSLERRMHKTDSSASASS